MKKLSFLTLLILSCQLSFSQDVITVHAGASGIFISCGSLLPKDFSYRISRENASNGGWQQMAVVHFPANEGAWRGNMMTEAMQNPGVTIPDSAVIIKLWQNLKASTTRDSLYAWVYYPYMLAACGTGWWDRAAVKGQQYKYKIEKIQKGNVLSTETTDAVSFPGKAPDFEMQPDSLQGNGIEVSVKFQLIKYKGMGRCKVYRAYYKRSDFSLIHPLVLFSNSGGKQYLTLYDESVVNKAQYSYYVAPYDIYGNEGNPSDTVNVYNTRINTMKAIVSNFNGASKVKENAIRLSWHIMHPEDVISIDIYKALEYDGYYTRIASVPPTDTEFSDLKVRPVTTYFYTLVLRLAYGRTFPSARTVAIFRANRNNPFPPDNLKAVRKGNVVTLSWRRVGKEIRGYYLYRSSSLTGQMQPITNIILNKDCISVDQDANGQGERIQIIGDTEIWAKKLQNGKVAVLMLNRNKTKTQNIILKFPDIGINQKARIKDVYASKELGSFFESFTKSIQPRSGLFILVR